MLVLLGTERSDEPENCSSKPEGKANGAGSAFEGAFICEAGGLATTTASTVGKAEPGSRW